MRLFTIFLLIFWANLVQAEIYKWTDKNGQVHYTDKPVSESGSAKKVVITPTTTQDESNASAQKLKLLIEQQKTQKALQDAQDSEKEKRDQLARMEMQSKCSQAKIALQDLSFKGRLYRRDKNGEREWIGDDERDAKQKETQDFYSRNCQ